MYTLKDKEDAYWAPFFLQSLKRIPRAASCAVMVEGTSERPTFYDMAPPTTIEVQPKSAIITIHTLNLGLHDVGVIFTSSRFVMQGFQISMSLCSPDFQKQMLKQTEQGNER